MQRRVEPELLDTLPVADPRAIGSRRDLERLNAWMRHAAILARLIHQSLNGRELHQIADLGAGDGKFMLGVASRLARRWPQVTVRMLDRQNALQPDIQSAFRALTWNAFAITIDVFEGLRHSRLRECQVIIANLFLHHFTTSQLSELLAAIEGQTQLFIALEPNRSPFALLLSHCVRAIGCNDITRHDAPISVRAGFAGHELSDLWPNPPQWSLQERSAGLFSHVFLAQRRTP
jgi:hypothetical protein